MEDETSPLAVPDSAAPNPSDTASEPVEVSQKRRRRARRAFTLAVGFAVALVGYLAANMLIPTISEPNLSAKPAPADPILAANWSAPVPMQRDYQSDTLVTGDTLAGLLARANVDAVEADAALDELRGIYDVRRLKPGQEVRVFREWPAGVDRTTHAGRFAGFDFIPQPRRRLIVRRRGHQEFEAVEEQRELSEKYFLSDSLITSSVYEAARGGGMSPNLVVSLIRLFSFAIDFQRDIRQGDQLEVLYTRRFDDNNLLAEEGDIMFAALTNRGKRYAYWRVPHEDGSFGYYDEEGRSVQRLLMRTPVDGARLSSRFGMRRHPILGYTRLHRGLDFAAPTGTPIYAAGNGVITSIGTYGNNGKYIRIRHKNGYDTAYAHMNGFARRLKKGSKVRQGQIIGYVGRTGLATGPHLHYEVMHYDKPVNPRELNVPSQSNLNDTAKLEQIKTGIAARVTNLASNDNSLRSLPRRRAVLRTTGQ